MKTILSTLILCLVLPWNLKGNITDGTTSFIQTRELTTENHTAYSTNVESTNSSPSQEKPTTGLSTNAESTNSLSRTQKKATTGLSTNVESNNSLSRTQEKATTGLSTNAESTNSLSRTREEPAIGMSVTVKSTNSSSTSQEKPTTGLSTNAESTKSSLTPEEKSIIAFSENAGSTNISLTNIEKKDTASSTSIDSTTKNPKNYTTSFLNNTDSLKQTLTDPDKYTTKSKTENHVPSNGQMSENQRITTMRQTNSEFTLMRILTSASQTSLHLSSKLPLITLTKRNVVNIETEMQQNTQTTITPEVVIATKYVQQTTKNSIITETSVTINPPKTDATQTEDNFHTTLLVNTNTAGNVESVTTKTQPDQMNSLAPTTENTPKVILTTTSPEVNQTDSNEKTNATDWQTNGAVISTKSKEISLISTTLSTTASIASSVKITTVTSATTVMTTTAKTTTDATSIKETTETDNTDLDYETSSTTQIYETDTTIKTTSDKDLQNPEKNQNPKSHPGPILAGIIITILIIMFIAIGVILLRQHQRKKTQMENSDWAGPSPFIESDIQTYHNEDGSFQSHESKGISLQSFLPQRFSKRLSVLKEADEVRMEILPTSSTFGKAEQDIESPLNGEPKMDQNKTFETIIPATDAISDPTVTETENNPASPTSDANNKPTANPDPEILSTPLPETESTSAHQPTFEDVDLNCSVEENPVSKTPPNDVPISPSPPIQ